VNAVPSDVSARLLVDAQAQLGECPLWCEREQALYWTDIDGCLLSRWQAASGQVQRWPLPQKLGSFALCERPGWLLLGLADGVALFELATGRLGPLTPVEADVPHTRINDGRCDAQGRFVFGMFQHGAQGPAVGGFYRVSLGLGAGAALQVERLPLPPAVVANSIAFSPDGTRLYFTDTPTRQIWCVDYPADGPLGPPQAFARLADDDGLPDGSTVDAHGRLWTALWGAGCVVCFDAQGREVQRVPAPATFTTCPAFGGRDYGQLFVTSSRKAVAVEALAEEPEAGGVFQVSGASGLQGLPERRFAAA
jgi:L-arabinonolactonase